MTLDRIFVGLLVGHEHGIGEHDLINDAQALGPDGRTRLGHFDDTVGQPLNDLGFRGTPGIKNVDVNALFPEVAPGEILHLSGNALASQVFRLPVRGIAGDGEYPAARAQGRLGVDKVAYLNELILKIHLADPVAGSDAGIKDAVSHKAADLLHAGQGKLQFRIVHVREIIAFVPGNLPAGTGEEVLCGLLKRTFRYAEFKNGLS